MTDRRWDTERQEWVWPVTEDEAKGEKIARLRAALVAAWRSHYVCEDCWYSCPKSGQSCNNEIGNACTCGADEHNAKIDAVLNETRDV